MKKPPNLVRNQGKKQNKLINKKPTNLVKKLKKKTERLFTIYVKYLLIKNLSI